MSHHDQIFDLETELICVDHGFVEVCGVESECGQKRVSVWIDLEVDQVDEAILEDTEEELAAEVRFVQDDGSVSVD